MTRGGKNENPQPLPGLSKSIAVSYIQEIDFVEIIIIHGT